MPTVFNPRSPVRGATRGQRATPGSCEFQSTLPVWGATISALSVGRSVPDFNPRSPCGERHGVNFNARITSLFQSTLPAWGATWCGSTGKSSAVFQSTLPVWGATGYPVLLFFQFEFQSTLPVWGATASCMFWHRLTYISIHAPRVGSDIWKPWTSLPTPYFNPRSPCGERRRTICLTLRHTRFQSTLPVWGATMGIR